MGRLICCSHKHFINNVIDNQLGKDNNDKRVNLKCQAIIWQIVHGKCWFSTHGPKVIWFAVLARSTSRGNVVACLSRPVCWDTGTELLWVWRRQRAKVPHCPAWNYCCRFGSGSAAQSCPVVLVGLFYCGHLEVGLGSRFVRCWLLLVIGSLGTMWTMLVIAMTAGTCARWSCWS